MKIGIIGLPQVGKTTLFNLLTANKAQTGFGNKTKANVGVANVPDPRIDFLSSHFKPKKTTYAQIEFIDLPGLMPSSPGNGSGSSNFLENLTNVDALVNVTRGFEDDAIPHVLDSIDPARDTELILGELLIADWTLVESRLERIAKMNKGKANAEKDKKLLEKCKEALENQTALRYVDFTDDEALLLRTYSFYTMKPVITVVNLSEEQFITGDYQSKEELEEYCNANNIPLLTMSAKLEAEIAELDEDDRKLFMADLGISESGINRLASLTFAHIGLISFFTVGEDEVRAWTINKGTIAKEAAGKIHSDLERGFIRAEVISYEDFHKLGSMAKAKETGTLRLEGKEYVVQDGDIMSIRFNV